ncbi:hypothetical protein [Actinophytocola sp.]|uniref:hypothetical protein n=1 Tax=Actinophytocola sp. TaxID=1872138 RepID=UPI002D807EA8|nr:hypothetical protein [Actinophytocola sp.]HET9139433.1 hypothetical protein [Actinophytocola sp.]
MVRVIALLGIVVSVLTGAGAAAADPVGTEAVAYGAFRVVRSEPGTPSTPQVSLPEGYSFVTGNQYRTATRADWYGFIQGPPADSVPVTVRWPEVAVDTVVTGRTRVPLTRDPADPDAVTFTIPVSAPSANAMQPTVQMWTYLSSPASTGLVWIMEHNHPDRTAGPWTTVPVPAAQSAAFLNLLTAVEAVLRDSGLIAQAQARGHFFQLEGFETNNTLHTDNPPHWHLSYYPGPTTAAPRATVPHFWLDSTGKTFYNGQDVQGSPRARYYAGDPAPIHDGAGNLVLTTTIRADGGLDIEPAAGPRYALTTDPALGFATEVRILRDGRPWRAVRVTDDARTGLMVTHISGLGSTFRQSIIRTYDPQTCLVTSTSTKTRN